MKTANYKKIISGLSMFCIAFGLTYKIIRHDIKLNYGKTKAAYSVIPDNIYKHSANLVQEECRSKGGVVGTDGKGVVALRFDDYQNIFREKLYPMLLDRNLPCSMALISRFDTAQKWGIGTTWDDIRNWNKNGVEIWSHGTDHRDYDKRGYEGLYEQIVTSKSEIQAQNIKIAGFALPGVEANTKYSPYNGLTKPTDFDSQVGILLMKNY